MRANYKAHFYDDSGILKAVVVDFRNLVYTKKVNEVGTSMMVLNAQNPVLKELSDKWLVEILRKPKGGVWVSDFTGLFDEIEWSQPTIVPSVKVKASEPLTMLSWRVSGYRANTPNRTFYSSLPAETIAKSLVSYNATSLATTANGRVTDGVISGLTVEADNEQGKVMDWYCAWDNLLQTLQELAEDGGGDFDLIRTGATEYEFRWHDGQLGIDRTNEVLFAMNRGNMANPVYRQVYSSQRTCAITGGKGEEEERDIVIVKDADWASDKNVEMFVSATDVETNDGLISRGEAALAENKQEMEFSFDVLQTSAIQYGREYELGDLVSATNPFTGATETMKVNSVSVSLNDNGDENIAVQLLRLSSSGLGLLMFKKMMKKKEAKNGS